MKHVKVYLGDGVYAEFDDGGVWLTTDEQKNKIYLEERVLDALNELYNLWGKTL